MAFLAAVVVVMGALGYAVARPKHPHAPLLRASGIPAAVPTSTADLMGLSPVPTKPAPGFTLVDQHGATVSLSSLRGHAVVLEFMDPHCTDICPIVSQEFVDAYRDLGPKAPGTVFVAINVNQYFRTTADMASYSREQGLGIIPDWHFLTGPVPALRAAWHDYGIGVSAPSPDADIIHASIVYFIDARGQERFVAAPMVDHTKSGASYLPPSQITAWGRGIAAVSGGLS